MPKEDEAEWMDTMNNVHASVKGGMKYNTGKLLMVLYRPIDSDKESIGFVGCKRGKGVCDVLT